MSILPYQEIKRRCLTPEGHPLDKDPMIAPCYEKTVRDGMSFGLSESGYDMRINQTVTIWPITLPNLFNNWMYENPDDKWVRRLKRLGIGRKVTFRPFFVLASTIEQFVIPDDLMPKIEDKSSWARRGLSVFNTTAEPGWRGVLTLELKNNGHEVLHILQGAPIAQMVFYRLTEATEKPYKGKYQDQADCPVGSIYELGSRLERRPDETDAQYLERLMLIAVEGAPRD